MKMDRAVVRGTGGVGKRAIEETFAYFSRTSVGFANPTGTIR